jgi:arginase family enzyme
VDLRESITTGDLGDVFTIPANIEKTFDQITKAVGHVYSSGAFPVVLGRDHSIGYPTTRAVAARSLQSEPSRNSWTSMRSAPGPHRRGRIQ